MKTIMKIFQTGFLILGINAISFTSFSQTDNFKLSDLKGKTWNMQGLTDKTDEANYDNNKLIHTLTDITKTKYVFTFEYYLCDSIVKIFDSTKVGTIMEGKYIVTRVLRDNKTNPTQPQPVSVYEIVELNSTKLVIRNIKQQNLIEYKIR